MASGLDHSSKGGSSGVTPIPLSPIVANQAHVRIVPATTTILAANVLPTTSAVSWSAAEGRPCASAQWDAARPSVRSMANAAVAGAIRVHAPVLVEIRPFAGSIVITCRHSPVAIPAPADDHSGTAALSGTLPVWYRYQGGGDSFPPLSQLYPHGTDIPLAVPGILLNSVNFHLVMESLLPHPHELKKISGSGCCARPYPAVRSATAERWSAPQLAPRRSGVPQEFPLNKAPG